MVKDKGHGRMRFTVAAQSVAMERARSTTLHPCGRYMAVTIWSGYASLQTFERQSVRTISSNALRDMP